MLYKPKQADAPLRFAAMLCALVTSTAPRRPGCVWSADGCARWCTRWSRLPRHHSLRRLRCRWEKPRCHSGHWQRTSAAGHGAAARRRGAPTIAGCRCCARRSACEHILSVVPSSVGSVSVPVRRSAFPKRRPYPACEAEAVRCVPICCPCRVLQPRTCRGGVSNADGSTWAARPHLLMRRHEQPLFRGSWLAPWLQAAAGTRSERQHALRTCGPSIVAGLGAVGGGSRKDRGPARVGRLCSCPAAATNSVSKTAVLNCQGDYALGHPHRMAGSLQTKEAARNLDGDLAFSVRGIVAEQRSLDHTGLASLQQLPGYVRT